MVVVPLETGEANRPNLFPLDQQVTGKVNRLNLSLLKERAEGLTRNRVSEGPTETKETTQREPMIGPILTLVERLDSSEPTKQEQVG